MQSSLARHKLLLKAVDAEPVCAGAVLARCAAGLAAIALVSLIGLRAPIKNEVPLMQTANAAPQAQAGETKAIEVKYQGAGKD